MTTIAILAQAESGNHAKGSPFYKRMQELIKRFSDLLNVEPLSKEYSGKYFVVFENGLTLVALAGPGRGDLDLDLENAEQPLITPKQIGIPICQGQSQGQSQAQAHVVAGVTSDELTERALKNMNAAVDSLTNLALHDYAEAVHKSYHLMAQQGAPLPPWIDKIQTTEFLAKDVYMIRWYHKKNIDIFMLSDSDSEWSSMICRFADYITWKVAAIIKVGSNRFYWNDDTTWVCYK